jgi:hypothetical protein
MTIELIDKNGNKLASGHLVADGQRLRVSMAMMDSAPPNIEAITRSAMTDAMMPSAAMHRPGSLALSDADRTARDKALDARDARLVGAWKNLPPLDATSADATQRTTPEDVAQINGAWQRKNARTARAWRMGAK